jgi:hypothetical protein
MTYQIKQLNERTTKGIEDKTTTVHDYLILQTMLMHGESTTLERIVVDLAPTPYQTKDPLIKSVKWHLNKLVKEGVVTFTPDEPVVKPAKVKKVKVETTVAA